MVSFATHACLFQDLLSAAAPGALTFKFRTSAQILEMDMKY